MPANTLEQIEQLNAIGASLSKEKDRSKLLEIILIGAKEITNEDAGTLYLVENNALAFEIMRTDTLNFAMGGTTGKEITLPPIPLNDESGKPNLQNISAYAAVKDEIVNIPDAYNAQGFDFKGIKAYDKQNNYRSTSFLTIPMKNHENRIIGVLQLINRTDSKANKVIAFSEADEKLAKSLASQAAVAISNFTLVENLRELLEKFIEVIAAAIDDKSPYTGGHCRRVPDIATLTAQSINDTKSGKFKDTEFTEQELYEIKIAALLHDCGKITTPVHVVDKATKLETIFDRMAIIDQRIETLIKDAKIALLELKIDCTDENTIEEAEASYEAFKQQLKQDHDFLKNCNLGSEFMSDELITEVDRISAYQWTDHNGDLHPLINDDELMNLRIRKGTLNDGERKIINHHIVMTQNMLEALPFPRHLKNVPEIAGNHHERMDGKGYPGGVKAGDLSVQARLMCIADVFEALTATDRPYKKPMKLSMVLNILGKMTQESHLDSDIFQVFISEATYMKYAEEHLEKEQIDEIDLNNIPGYTPAPN